MLGGVLQRGAGGACEEEEEDPDAAAEEDGRLQLVQGLAGGDPDAADHRVPGDRETSAAGGRTFHRGGRCCGYQQLNLSGHLLQVDHYGRVKGEWEKTTVLTEIVMLLTTKTMMGI